MDKYFKLPKTVLPFFKSFFQVMFNGSVENTGSCQTSSWDLYKPGPEVKKSMLSSADHEI